MPDRARLDAALADRYRIERELGAGGMATVYLATDPRHDRKVAIKVLNPELAAVLGAERFVQEIRTTAALQHPHILPLFDSGEADGFLFYVMPYVQGETVRDKLNRETQLGVEEAVRIATEVADALQYAHGQGVIHRDIKPENILLHNGRALVADFGIALAVSAAGGGRMTETGLSLGTPHYMSPEQAAADRDITGRSDVYSLASVLYEMLTGEPPHMGTSVQQILMKIITDVPRPARELRKAVPLNVSAAVEQALERLPADRFETAKAFADALANPTFVRAGGRTAPGAAVTPSHRWWVPAALALVTVAAAGLLVGRAIDGAGADTRDIGLPPNAPMQMADWYRSFAVAADGSFLVYVARAGDTTALWYRSLDGFDARPIPGTEGAGGTPRLSPDGKRVAFVSGVDLKVADLDAGTVSSVASAGAPLGGGWLPDGTIFFADEDGRRLRWIDAQTGPRREVEVEYCILPQVIGTGDRVLCGGGADKYASVRYLDRGTEKRPFRRAGSESGAFVLGSDFRLVDGRYLIYLAIDGALMATRINDLDSLTVGRSVTLVSMVRRNAYSGAGQYDLTQDGALVFAPGINAEVGRLMRVGRDGRTTPLNVPAVAHLRFAPSPDSRRLASVVEGVESQELRIYDLDDRSYEVPDRGFFIGAPSWSPDGSRLAYRKMDDPGGESLVLRRLTAPDPPQVLLSRRGPLHAQPSSYLADDFLLVGAAAVGAQVMLIDPTTTPATIDSLGFSSLFSSISPDRQWIAIQRLGIPGIELQPWPARDRRYLVDPAGFEPRWRSTTELGFQVYGSGAVYQVTIGRSSGSPVGRRDVIVQDSRFADTPGWSFAFAPNGDLIYLQSPAETLGYYLRVIPRWVDQMKRAVDEANP